MRARCPYYAPFPALARGAVAISAARDDGYCPGTGRLIDRTRFKCYRSLMLIWPVHLDAAWKSRIIARNWPRADDASIGPRRLKAVFTKGAVAQSTAVPRRV